MSAGAIDKEPINNQRHTDAVERPTGLSFESSFVILKDLNSVLVSQA